MNNDVAPLVGAYMQTWTQVFGLVAYFVFVLRLASRCQQVYSAAREGTGVSTILPKTCWSHVRGMIPTIVPRRFTTGAWE